METKIPKSMIAGVQSVTPVEVTQQHRRIRSVTIRDPVGVGIFRRTLNIVMYYKQEGDSRGRGWLVTGWIRESLGRAMTEQPMLSGRLRRRRTTTAEEEGLEVVANDSGVRMVEAMFPASLPEFLEMVKRDKRRAEAETVFWKDIDEVEPQFSPLLYVQVTNFESGGYSIGISCSILIADLLLETNFLTKWAQIQTSLAHSKTTIFHLPSLQKDFRNSHIELSRSDSVLDRGEPITFQAKICPKMSLLCMKKVVVTLEKVTADVLFFVKEQGSDENCDGMKVEVYSGDEAISGCDHGWDFADADVGVVNVSLVFGERLEGTSISCWVGCVSEGVVLVVPSTSGDAKLLTKFIVALPKE